MPKSRSDPHLYRTSHKIILYLGQIMPQFWTKHAGIIYKKAFIIILLSVNGKTPERLIWWDLYLKTLIWDNNPAFFSDKNRKTIRSNRSPSPCMFFRWTTDEKCGLIFPAQKRNIKSNVFRCCLVCRQQAYHGLPICDSPLDDRRIFSFGGFVHICWNGRNQWHLSKAWIGQRKVSRCRKILCEISSRLVGYRYWGTFLRQL